MPSYLACFSGFDHGSLGLAEVKRPKPHPRAYVVQPLNEHEVQIIEARRLLRAWQRETRYLDFATAKEKKATEKFFKEFPQEPPR